MTPLDDMIREAASRGLSGLTLWKTSDGRYQANAKHGDGWRVEHSIDPADALRLVLSTFATDKPPQPEQDIFA